MMDNKNNEYQDDIHLQIITNNSVQNNAESFEEEEDGTNSRQLKYELSFTNQEQGQSFEKYVC